MIRQYRIFLLNVPRIREPINFFSLFGKFLTFLLDKHQFNEILDLQASLKKTKKWKGANICTSKFITQMTLVVGYLIISMIIHWKLTYHSFFWILKRTWRKTNTSCFKRGKLRNKRCEKQPVFWIFIVNKRSDSLQRATNSFSCGCRLPKL